VKPLAATVGLVLLSSSVVADSSTWDAALGAGLGGAVGAAIGHQLGGRDGAILGGVIGGGAGAAVTTSRDRYPRYETYHRPTRHYWAPRRQHGYFCPPGQAKKGRC
jgi:uncharacterized protein YcfJ